MPVHNHYYPDPQGRIGTLDSVRRLFTEGPTLPVAISLPPQLVQVLTNLGQPIPPPETGTALIDTGATLCVVDERVMSRLGVPAFGYTDLRGVGGTSTRPTYPASLAFPGTNIPNLTFSDFVGAPLAESGIIALIGRNVLASFVFTYNGPGGCITLSY